MTAYYNEIDPYAAQWLRNLIAAGHIAPGDVDERSIEDVSSDELAGYTQCHFFAGIGGWSCALRLAGWPDDRPVWTGSCPCQPFSAAGKGDGFSDERHLWPHFHRLIRERQPVVVFGEQVAAAIGLNWLDHVSSDLEQDGYACGAVVLPACSVGAPHIRQRLWFVAERVVNTFNTGLEGHAGNGYRGNEPGWEQADKTRSASEASGSGKLADTDTERCGEERDSSGEVRPCGCSSSCEPADALDGFWRAADWLYCRDGKWRPVEPGTFPLAARLPNRVERLRAYGNAIVPQVAAEVIKAYMECRP